jgi:hypothetical protein
VPLTVIAGSLIRQDVVPMLVGYVLTMGALALGLWVLRVHPAAPEARGSVDGEGPPDEAGASARAGWPDAIRRVVSTAVGGYLLLVTVVIVYYYGVARQGPGFLWSAVTGNAMLAFVVALPAFLVISWVVERRRRDRPRDGEGPGDRPDGTS